jgi:hypothetical protein
MDETILKIFEAYVPVQVKVIRDRVVNELRTTYQPSRLRSDPLSAQRLVEILNMAFSPDFLTEAVMISQGLREWPGDQANSDGLKYRFMALKMITETWLPHLTAIHEPIRYASLKIVFETWSQANLRLAIQEAFVGVE